MGRIKEKKTTSLSLFYLRFFAYIFIAVLGLALFLLSSFNWLVSKELVYPANEAEKQAVSAQTIIQDADKITPELIPELCEYVVFDFEGNATQGTMHGQSVRRAWDALQQNKSNADDKYYIFIQRDKEYCVLQYQFLPQYKSSVLRKYLVSPQTLIFLIAIFGTFIIIITVAIWFGRVLRKRLSPLTVAVSKIEQQELDFDISPSGIKEIDAILNSMDNMRIALKTSLEQQWRLEQTKNQQMSALAHDLKTPLTIIRGNAELLLESEISEAHKKYVDYIESSSLQMQDYVQTLIEVTRSWQGYQFHKQEINCDLFFREIEQQIQGLCTINHVFLLWKCHCVVKQLSVDHDLFIRAIVNVAENAIEHTPPGGNIYFSINEESSSLFFVIQDTGKGFSKEALKHGTERFFMDDASRNSKSHFGIGLYAANSVVEEHGGQLTLENSAETGGGKVTIQIPC